MKNILTILTLFCILTLPTLSSAQAVIPVPDKDVPRTEAPFKEEIQPGEPSLKDNQPKEGRIQLEKGEADLACGKSGDIAKLVKNIPVFPYFLATDPEKAVMLMTNPETKVWTIILFPATNPGTACFVATGKGFTTLDDATKK